MTFETRPTVEVDAKTRIKHELHQGKSIEAWIVIERPAIQVFSFIRDFSHLPLFIQNLEKVENLSAVRSRWKWRARDVVIETDWDIEIIAEIRGRMISWQTLNGSEFHQAGSLWLREIKPGASTEVSFHLRYHSDKKRFAHIFGDSPEKVVADDLLRLKNILEEDWADDFFSGERKI